jgi:3-oxoacyl-[acyl-carrier-protein] synthase II
VSSNGRVSVVVTGLGATTPLGGDVASTWSAMLAGTSGVRPITDDWAESLPVRIAAPAAADPVPVIGRVQARRMDRCEQFAMVAAREAWADAGSPTVDPYRLGVAVTSGIGGIGSTLTAYDTLHDKGWDRISPFTVPMLMPNGAAGWISIEFGAKAGAHALVSACASGAESIGYGIDMIRSGRADVVLAGGAEAAILPLNLGAFAVMRAMSTRNDEPSRASRPFDKGRDGFVLGEGAGVVVLESLTHALARGARIYAVAAGAGYSSDAFHISHGAPDGAGVAFAMTSALRDAGVSPFQVAHINAHATSTQEGDPLEARAIEAALGSAADGCVVSATKSMTGHLLGGAGAIESVAAILALRDRVAPPTINLEDVDDEVAIDVATAPRPLRPLRTTAPTSAPASAPAPAPAPAETGADGNGDGDGNADGDGAARPMAVLNNAFGFGGHNVTLAFTEFIPQEA